MKMDCTDFSNNKLTLKKNIRLLCRELSKVTQRHQVGAAEWEVR